MLSQQQQQDFQEQGYVIVENLLSAKQLEQMKNAATEIVDAWDDEEQHHIFTTKNNDRSGDDYFLDSAERIRCFYEEDAFDDAGRLVQPRAQCINKIGHALHELDPVFSGISHLPVLGEIAADLGMQQPQVRQSMYIFKQPRIGGEVKWHQDATFFYTVPSSVITYWFAVEDATLNNGCLWVEPGGQHGPLRERFMRDGDLTMMQTLDEKPWPLDMGIPLEVSAGTLVCFHGRLPHYSAPNRSQKSRQAYTLHVTDGVCEYAASNWLQAAKLPLRGFGH
ncbi:MAG: phytanoyl-CoA dioxygenase family protein [Thiolinea sp.]